VLAAALLPRLLLTRLLTLLAGLLLAALLLTGLLLATLLLLAAVLLAALLSAALPTLIGIVHDRSCSEVALRRRENGRREGSFRRRFYLTVQQGKLPSSGDQHSTGGAR